MRRARRWDITWTTAAILVLALSAVHASAQSTARGVGVIGKAERRLALVIGNGAYAFSPLRNPVHDARDMATRLRTLGFEVIHKENLTRQRMRQAIRQFGRRLRKGGVGLFYYAGHGVQVKGQNFLIPIGADVEAEFEVEDEGVNASTVLRMMESANNSLNIAIFDACRNNPFARSFRSSSRGLARMDEPSGALIAYSTAPGSVAADGEGRNSTYTKHLLTAMGEAGLTIEQVFKRVRVAVERDTDGKQTPWEESSLKGEFCFAGCAPLPAVLPGPLSEQPKLPTGQTRVAQLLGKAQELFQRQHYTTPKESNALNLYRQPLRLEPDNLEALRKIDAIVETYRAWAEARLRRGDLRKAKRYYQKVLEVKPEDQAAAEKLREIEARLAEPAPPPLPTATGDLFITSRPSGAMTVRLDGAIKARETPSLIERIPVGEHRLEVDQQGLRHAEARVKVAASTINQVQLELLRLKGQVAITSQPSGATVIINSRQAGATPFVADLETGEYQV